MNRKILQKVQKAWQENEKRIQEEQNHGNKIFLFGYKLAINEMYSWIIKKESPTRNKRMKPSQKDKS